MSLKWAIKVGNVFFCSRADWIFWAFRAKTRKKQIWQSHTFLQQIMLLSKGQHRHWHWHWFWFNVFDVKLNAMSMLLKISTLNEIQCFQCFNVSMLNSVFQCWFQCFNVAIFSNIVNILKYIVFRHFRTFNHFIS